MVLGHLDSLAFRQFVWFCFGVLMFNVYSIRTPFSFRAFIAWYFRIFNVGIEGYNEYVGIAAFIAKLCAVCNHHMSITILVFGLWLYLNSTSGFRNLEVEHTDPHGLDDSFLPDLSSMWLLPFWVRLPYCVGFFCLETAHWLFPTLMFILQWSAPQNL